MKKISFKNQFGEKIVGILHINKKTKKAIIMVHGFTGHKEGYFTSGLSNLLEKNYNLLRYDFSGNKESEGKFEDQSYSKYIEELHLAIEFMKNKGFKEIILVGHSLGATISLFEYQKYKDANKIIFIAPAFYLKKKFMLSLVLRFFITLIKGKISYKDAFGNEITLKRKFFTERLFVYKKHKALKILNIPSLGILAEKDKSINNKKCEKLFKKYKIPYHIVKEAAHNFREERYLKEVSNYIIKWLK
ncbi:MAG: alpha/beta fold hydrolase [Candidatus Nanoarchaeia archaeon]|nr:alpha/beta fold hydrolase [Candidatus Nanoarchaeia archaeon]MDD5587929.1 alpha/beta fold hydrolase [Candidatus Nanoarchaeia archaeon]